MSMMNDMSTDVTSSKALSTHRSRGVPNCPSLYEADLVLNVKEALPQSHRQEYSIKCRLDDLMRSQGTLYHGLGNMDVLRAHLSSNAVPLRSVSGNMVSDAASIAKRISEAVKRLDLEQDRVKKTLWVVEQVVELKACVLGVTGCMGAPQDWEAAAIYLNRASKIITEIVNGKFAEVLVPTAEVPDPPKLTLEKASDSLCGLFLREFEKAAREGNGTKITRFFKLFPLIGKSDVGLDVYGRYVCQGVASRARASLNMGTGAAERKERLFYANALIQLFEHIAQIVMHHSRLVEGHYGVGRMVKVIERLQLEADIQGGILIDTWSDERNIDLRLTDIRSYAFTFLVQSFLPGPPARSNIPRTSSPAKENTNAERNAQEDNPVDLKEIDGVLNEIALMLGRWSVYSNFIAANCMGSQIPLQAPQRHLSLPQLLFNSALNRKIVDRLISPFNTMTTFFFRRSIEMAFQLDEQPSGLSLNLTKPLISNPPYITSAVDDVMFILNQVIERSLLTSQREVVSNVIPSIFRVLGSDFIGMIQRKMRDECYPRAVSQGSLPPEQITISFLVLVNGLDVAAEYIKRIIQPRIEESPGAMLANIENSPSPTSISTLYSFNDDAEIITNLLRASLQSFENKTFELIGDSIHVIMKNIIKPRLRPVLVDSFRDIDYEMTPNDLERLNEQTEADGDHENSVEATVQYRFQHGWDALIKPIARVSTVRNYERVLSAAVLYLSEVLEKRIWSYYGRINDLGAIRLERDVASIISIAVKGGRYGLRDTFGKCAQICLVMNMEEDEWEDLQASCINKVNDEIEWKIDNNERFRARAMIRGP